MKSNQYKSPLGRARGMGSAHEGAEHWLWQRITAISNLVLVSWLLWSVVHFQGWDYETFTTWLSAPVNAILMILALLSVFYHAALGSQVIVEDYVSCEVMKTAKLIGIKLFFFAMAVASVFSVLKIAFAG